MFHKTEGEDGADGVEDGVPGEDPGTKGGLKTFVVQEGDVVAVS